MSVSQRVKPVSSVLGTLNLHVVANRKSFRKFKVGNSFWKKLVLGCNRKATTHGVNESTRRRRTAGYNKVYFSWYYVKLGSLAELELFKKHSAAVVAVGSLNMHAGKRPNTPSGPAANAIPYMQLSFHIRTPGVAL